MPKTCTNPWFILTHVKKTLENQDNNLGTTLTALSLTMRHCYNHTRHLKKELPAD